MRHQAVADDQAGHHHADHAHQLDQDVQARAAGVLERVAHGVADDGGLVGVGTLAAVVRRASMYFLALSHAPPALAMKMATQKPQVSVPTSRPITPPTPSKQADHDRRDQTQAATG